MKPLREVAESYMALADAQRQLRHGACEEAAANCRKAMEVSRTIPAEEAFDHIGFDAFCHAGLAEALGRMGVFDESLISAERALHYFNRRGELNQDDGKLWIAAVFSRALALDGLERGAEALAEFRKASEMIAERKGDLPGREEFLSTASDSITRLERSVKPGKPAGYKAWWEFWS